MENLEELWKRKREVMEGEKKGEQMEEDEGWAFQRKGYRDHRREVKKGTGKKCWG